MAVDKLVDSVQLDSDLTSIANAIRTKGGTSAQLVFPTGFVDAIDAIETGGGDVDLFVSSGPFNGDLSFDVTKVGLVFRGATGNYSLAFPNVTSFIGTQNFSSQGITSLRLPNYTGTLPSELFYKSNSIRTLFAPKSSGGTISNSTGMTCAVVGNISSGSSTCNGCPNLTVVDTNKCASMNRTFYKGCGSLGTLIIRASTVQSMSYLNAFNTTKFADGNEGGTIYVPQALIASYQAATNWSTLLGYVDGEGNLQNQILPIEGSIYENAYADGTPIT